MLGVESPPLAGGFLPRLLDAHLSESPRPLPSGPRSVEGVVLFVDIVGSTSMTDRLLAPGPVGAERLGGFLNVYFRELIGIVAAHGGDVVRIDGDAVIAFWRCTTGQTRTYLFAARAAEAIRRVRPAWPVEPPETLRHRIVLVTGRFQTLVLSHAGRRKFLLFSGAPLQTIGRIMRNGAPGDIILDDGMTRLLSPIAAVEPVEPDSLPACRLIRLEPAADGVPGSADAACAPPGTGGLPANAFLPLIVLERVPRGLSDWLAEFRTVSIVYAWLGDPDLSTDEAAGGVQARFRALADVADAMKVEIFEVIAAEKGVVAKIALGLPPFGAEGAANRAVEIARRIRDEWAARGVVFAIGIATGRLFCGDVGSAIRREYVLSGAAMNYGARLMEAAHGGVLCDAATVQEAGARFSFSADSRIAIRGRKAPLTAHWLIDAHASVRPAIYGGRLCGRDREFAELLARVDRVCQREGGLVAIEGEAGGGKSRLLAELADAAGLRGCAVITANADAIDGTTAYFVFRQVLRQLLAHGAGEPDPSPGRIRQSLGDALAGTPLLPRMALIEDVMPLGIEDPGLAAQIRGAARRDGIAEILVALLGARMKQQPLMLLLDDLQWIDALSADLLLAVGARLPGLLAVVASRPDEPAEMRHGVRVLERAQESIVLRRLEAEQTTRMVGELLQARTIPHRLAAFVHERSEGLPIHVEQLALSLREEGIVELVNGRARLPGSSSLPVRFR